MIFLRPFILLLGFYYPYFLFAAEAGGGGLPWENPLQELLESLQGPVAYSVSIIGFITAGATLVFGGEISEFTRRMFYLVLVISILALSVQAYSSLFAGGALV